MGRIRKLLAATGVVAAAAAGLVAVATPASAAAQCLVIFRISYNSPGTDTRTNTSLNGEWIQLHNRCATTVALTSSRIRDAAGHTYTFTSSTLGGGRYVKVHTGRGTNTATDRYWSQSWFIWNNDRDTASLYNHFGVLIGRCSYNNPHVLSLYC